MNSTPHSQSTVNEVASLAPAKEFSGKSLLVGMVFLALVMSSGLWIYWNLHTRPFLPLQRAIAQAFPKSLPQVQGGQRRIHKDTPKILRVTLRVKFNPEPAEAEEQVNSFVDQLQALAKQHLDFDSYNQFEVHLIQMQPEHAAKKRTVVRDITKLP